ncbi:MAG: tail protein X [Zoogloeaceae bacterium]|nr:tail protein X [Zoogloeaceae bacterium]
MAAVTYRTRDDEPLDAICRAHYGTGNETLVALVWRANPGLASHGPILPGGLLIVLPERPAVSQSQPLLDLWS